MASDLVVQKVWESGSEGVASVRIVQRAWESDSEGVVSVRIVQSAWDSDLEGTVSVRIVQWDSDSNVVTVGIAGGCHGRKCHGHCRKNFHGVGMVAPEGMVAHKLANYRYSSTFL